MSGPKPNNSANGVWNWGFVIGLLGVAIVWSVTAALPYLQQITLLGTTHVKPTNADFDYIVVGSGAGGGPLAVRLAQAGFRTLLIEAGPEYNSPNVSVPAFQFLLDEDEQVTFDYYVTEGPAGRAERPNVWYPRVGGLGGCPIHTSMIHMYPNPSDFNQIRDLFRDTTWDDSNMRKYFKRLEHFHVPPPEGISQDDTGHGYDGWTQVTRVNLEVLKAIPDPQVDALLQMANQSFPALPGGDINAPGGTNNEGWHFIPNAIDLHGARSSVYNFIRQALATPDIREYLTVWTNTLVTSLVFDEIDSTRIVGVNYVKQPYLYRASPMASAYGPLPQHNTVRAGIETVLAAGTFNTPQILMLSGIGDSRQLTRLGVQPRVHLPGVGQNLQDRIEISVNMAMRKGWVASENCTFEADSSDPCYVEYVKTGQSVYALGGALFGVLQKSTPSVPNPDLYILSAPLWFRGYRKGFAAEAAALKNVGTFLILKAHTNNTGTVALRSTDPRDRPLINFDHLRDPKDLKAVTGAVQHIRQLIGQPPVAQHVDHEILPGFETQTDGEVADYIRLNSWGHHACGTSRMGPSTDPLSVVDQNFKVYKIKGLRIVDASVWRNIPGYFINAPTSMLAEKAAEVMIADAKKVV